MWGLVPPLFFFFFNDTATTEIYTLSLHDALPISFVGLVLAHAANNMINDFFDTAGGVDTAEYTRALYAPHPLRSEEHTSELQSRQYLVCRLLLEKKKTHSRPPITCSSTILKRENH